MKDNTKQILAKVNETIEELESYKKYIEEYNSCAYSDRILENAINNMNEVEKIYQLQFNESTEKNDEPIKKDDSKRELNHAIKSLSLSEANDELEKERRLRIKSLPENFTVKDYCQIENKVVLIPYNRDTTSEINSYCDFKYLTYAMQNAVVKKVIDSGVLLLESTDKELFEKDLDKLGWSLNHEGNPNVVDGFL